MASLLESLNERELSNKPWKFPVLSAPVNRRVDDEYQGTAVVLNNLREAITASHWEEIEPAVNDVMMNLLDNSSESQLFVVTPLKKKQREYFIAHGGINLLMQLFRPPFLRYRDGRKIPTTEVRRKSETWNEILVILREICYAIPAVTDTYFSSDQMVFFFTLLHHQSVFDNSMSLLEEILAQREDTFQLSLIPDFYALIQKFSARQLAHFCRLLSLVLFEPEDRHIMDGTHVLHSTELLQLRRNRLAKNCGAVVERNQSLMLDMPGILPRLVHILRVINYGPNLAELINHNMAPQVPITSDILTFFSTTMGVSDWDHFEHLEQAVQRHPLGGQEDAGSPRSGRSARSPNGRGGSSGGDLSTLEDEDITAELLNSFAPAMGGDGQLGAAMDMANLVNVMQIAREMGIADVTPLGEALLFAQPGLQGPPPPPQSPPPAPGGILSSLRNSLAGGAASRGLERVHDIPAARARKELQFHAMLLSPHQIELLFVLCTLLSGRRKLSVQDQLAAAGLDAVLLQMFDRMSWGVPPTHPEGGAQVHTHGPNCTCDSAGSPLRVQYLRLIHNFYDRDFLGNANKVLMLSPTERAHVLSERMDSQLDVAAAEAEAGLMRKIMNTLMTEPSESVYKFWLSACVENFLRGSGRMTQSLVAQSGVLEHTLRQVISQHSDTSASLQTSFDLLGEVVKCNHTVLAQFDSLMSDDDFRNFRKVVLTNLIDSNVLLRSLYLTVDMVSFSYAAFESNAIAYPSPTSGLAQFGFYINCLGANMESVAEAAGERMGYLRETWVEFQPTVLSKRALQQQTTSTQLESSKSKGSNGSSRQKVTRSNWSALTKSPGRDSHFSRKGIDNSDEAQSGNALTTLGTGVLGALKSATKSFLRLSDGHGSSPSGKVAPFTPEVANRIEVARAGSDGGDGYSSSGEYTDCPNAPANGEAVRPLSGEFSLALSPGKGAVDMSKVVQDVLLAGSPAKSPLGQHGSDDNRFDMEVVKADAKSEEKEEEQPASTGGIHESYTREAAVELLRDAPSPQTPENISRIAEFLLEEKVAVIVRLMSTVSLTTINHENICCLNTALLLLLLDHKRGRLSATLSAVKQRADEELALARQQRDLGEDGLGVSLGGLLLGLSDGQTRPSGGGGSVRRGCCANCLVEAPSGISNATMGDDSAASAKEGEATLQFCGVCAPQPAAGATPVGEPANAIEVARSPDDNAKTATHKNSRDEGLKKLNDGGDADPAVEGPPLPRGGDVVFRNFRELLWYWLEYYLRRGRDRLSIEFSSHIPFRYWQSVVGLMCRDDGSPTSLLSAPIVLPPSPYSRPTPGHPAAFFADLNSVCNV